MVALEELAIAARDGEALHLRRLMQDWLRTGPQISSEPPPSSRDPQILAIAAAFAEMFAERLSQEPPPWAAAIGPCPEPIYLVRSARTMSRLRQQCEAESPLPLRRRRLYAPANYLQSA